MEKKSTAKSDKCSACTTKQAYINLMQHEMNRMNNDINENFQMRIKRLEELVECNLKDIYELQTDAGYDECSGSGGTWKCETRPRFTI